MNPLALFAIVAILAGNGLSVLWAVISAPRSGATMADFWFAAGTTVLALLIVVALGLWATRAEQPVPIRVRK